MQPLPPKLQEVYEKHYQNHSQPNSEELRSVFLAIAKHCTSMFLVLDALDECSPDQRKELCEFFSNIIESSSATADPSLDDSAPACAGGSDGTQQPSSSLGAIKLFVTSRKEPDIERVFRQKSFPTVEIEAKKVDRDIKIYVNAQIEQRIQDERLILRDVALKDKILTTLTTKASGMYVFSQHTYSLSEHKISNLQYYIGFYGLNFSWMRFVHKSRIEQ